MEQVIKEWYEAIFTIGQWSPEWVITSSPVTLVLFDDDDYLKYKIVWVFYFSNTITYYQHDITQKHKSYLEEVPIFKQNAIRTTYFNIKKELK